MSNLLETIKRLCEDRNITIAALERECNLGNATIKKWGTSVPSADKLSRVADYFNVTTDYLLGRELNTKDERDIFNDLETIRKKLSAKESGPVSFDGEEIPDDDAEMFLGQIEVMLRRLKPINKEKYNPYKNKK